EMFVPEPPHHLDASIKPHPGDIAAVSQMQVFWSDADGHTPLDIGRKAWSKLRRHLNAEAGLGRPQGVFLATHSDSGEIHARRAEKAGDKTIDRRVVELERLAHLLHDSVPHH